MSGTFTVLSPSPSGDIAATSLTPTFKARYDDAPATTSDPWTYRHLWEVRRVSDNALIWDSFTEYTGIDVDTWSPIDLTVPYAGPALSAGVSYKWRFRFTVQLIGGNFPAWGQAEDADTGYITFALFLNNTPSVTPISPAVGATLNTVTPTFVFNFSDIDTLAPHGTFDAYQFEVRRSSDSVSFWAPGITATNGTQQSTKQVSLLYAGTTLVSGTTYEWRARVRDGSGAFSAWTSWRTFTPAAVPNPPTITSPSGLTNTLTPTIAGTYNQGTGAAQAGFQYEIRQGLTTVIHASGDVLVAIATGQVYPGSPALTWGTQYYVRARSKDSAAQYGDWSEWTAFHTNAAPTTPTVVSPSEGRILGDTTPTLQWVHNDADGDAQTKARIELRTVVGDTAVTGYDSPGKELTQSSLTHDITEVLTQSPATAYKWRIQTTGLAGPGYGPYTVWFTFTVAEVPVITFVEPAVDEELAGPSFLVDWTFSGGSGTQEDYRVVVYAQDMVTVVYDSGITASIATQHLVPTGFLSNNSQYFVEVIVRDDLGQEATTGKRHIVTVFDPPATLTGLSVSFHGGTDGTLPYALISWDASALPLTQFIAYRVERRPSGSTGAWTKIAFIPDPLTTSYQDFRFTPGIELDYVATQIEDAGAGQVESDRPTPAQGSHTFESLYIHDADDPGTYGRFQVSSQQVGRVPDVEFLTRADGTVVAHSGPTAPRTYRASIRGAWVEGTDGQSQDVVAALDALIEAQLQGSVLLARQGRAVRLFCVMQRPSRNDSVANAFDLTLELIEVFYDEEVIA